MLYWRITEDEKGSWDRRFDPPRFTSTCRNIHMYAVTHCLFFVKTLKWPSVYKFWMSSIVLIIWKSKVKVAGSLSYLYLNTTTNFLLRCTNKTNLEPIAFLGYRWKVKVNIFEPRLSPVISAAVLHQFLFVVHVQM